jgi:hypothetical protein
MLCESLREGDVVYIPHRQTYGKVQRVTGLLVQVMTLTHEAIQTDRRNVKFINRTNREELDMQQEETIISICILPGFISKGAIVGIKGDLAATNTFDGEVDWNAIIGNTLGEIAAAERVTPETRDDDDAIATVPTAPKKQMGLFENQNSGSRKG